ncbi:MAG: FAD-dependent oxidoreductase, partial [Thermoguttaceae bacterium]
MQRRLQHQRRSDEEAVKEAGLILDFDEIARKGSMSREEISIAKAYGIYHSRQPGNHMARVVIPGGQITSVEARALARLASTYGPGRISFTTRQSAQLHCLRMKDLPGLLRDLREAGMTTFHGCGDDVRNVAACPWASICPHRVFDVLPHAREISRRLAACRELDNLPRKFKITLSGCEGCCGQPYINCIGLVAVRGGTGEAAAGFRVVVGGGMGWAPRVAGHFYGFVPADQAVDVCHAIVRLHRDHGDRYIRMYARLKFVVERLGVHRCRELLSGYLDEAGVDRSRIVEEPLPEAATGVPDRPLRRPDPRGTDALAIQQIKIPKGELAAEQLTRIAELSEMYADKHVYSTNRQNLELHGVDPRRLTELRGHLQSLGLETDAFFGLSDVVSCVGTTYCPLAVSSTHAMFDLLKDLVRAAKYAPIADKVLVNLCGCPNSCSPYRIADIGLRGLRVRGQSGSTEGYQVTVGGTQQSFGQEVGGFKQGDCPAVVRAILDTFLAIRSGDETLSDSVARLGPEPYHEAVAALGIEYVKAVNPLELSVFVGHGSTELDRKTHERDVPCRTACPAHTNIPEYIGHIAHGQFEEAHRINQEDNVLPNILGRICTRPCESRCRYQWTSVLGPVRICHLKRAAADGKPEPSRPLPPYFPASGKRVAIIGGGPAGLAAARELRRCGHEITLLERESYLGGQITMGVPAFRLPRDAVEEDFSAIIQSGIEVRYDTPVTAQGIDDLSRRYDAVLVAAGANHLLRLEMPGLPEDLETPGLAFMKRFNEGHPLPLAGDVVIVGGGFTAVDCARSARRMMGPQGNIAVMYRRGEAQMTASPEELEEMRREGIRIETLVSPVEVATEDGRLRAITFRRNTLSTDGDGRQGKKPAIRPVPGSEFTVPCNTLISAIGQTQDWKMLPPDVQPAGDYRTTRPNLFLAGDFSSGSGDVIHAVADGKGVSEVIDEFLMGHRRRRRFVAVEEASLTGRLRDHDLAEPPPMPVLALGKRGPQDEVELGLGPEAAKIHAWRCYLCNRKFEI